MNKRESSKEELVEMETILRRAEVGRLALSDGIIPYIVPVDFLYQNREIVFHCAFEGKKLEIMAKNPNCCFEVDEYIGKVSDHHDRRCHLDYDSVLAFGKAKIETNERRRLNLLQRFSEKYDEQYRRPPEAGGKKLKEADCNCVVIKIKKLTGRRERSVNGKTKKTMWEHTF